MFEGGDSMFNFVFIFIGIVFVIVFLIILFSIIKGITEWNKNNRSPKYNVNAKVVAKRTAVHGGGESRTYSEYFATFQIPNGERMEFKVKDLEFGLLIEGDSGELSFQGTRFLGFIRNEKIKLI